MSNPQDPRRLLRPMGHMPIPPSLQPKLQAMLNRGQPIIEDTVASVSSTHIDRHPGLMNTQTFPQPQFPTLRGRGGAALGGMAGRRQKPGFSLRDIDPSLADNMSAVAAGLGAGHPSVAHDPSRRPNQGKPGTPFSNFSKIVDPSGALHFKGKAVLHASGVNFSNGSSFAINMTQFTLQEELGKGNYGTVKRVLHKPTNVLMAMKEIRLELDDAKLNAIIMELDVLHRAVHDKIVEFYGAFFIESCVYYCMEYMDAGSLDKLQCTGVREDVLSRIAHSTVVGLKFLKDDLNIIHRGKSSHHTLSTKGSNLYTDVKPTNILVNLRGEVKLCDFGVSGELDKSLAKTNIGCQSYMAPERIKGESLNNLGTYSVASDVWSLGLTLVEISLGRYPYPPETYSNVFAQLTAIVHGDSPELAEDGYSEEARDFVGQCLKKEPGMRATYKALLAHPFLVHSLEKEVDMVGWIKEATDYRDQKVAAEREARLKGIVPTKGYRPQSPSAISKEESDALVAAAGSLSV